jgi:pimeloyl-ACP methyl ester carboxylesterase
METRALGALRDRKGNEMRRRAPRLSLLSRASRRTLMVAAASLGVLGALVVPGPALGSTSAVDTPVSVVHVSWGTIGYRSVGQGRPLVLLIGGGVQPALSIDDWPPSFIDALARHHRVLAVDYEGIGETTLRPGQLTIPRLANDTATFIAALHLQRPDVLGWSMGGFVAQALAVLHPKSLRRIVLCATAPGDGRGVPQKLNGTPSYPWWFLFPLDHQNASRAQAFELSIHQYPGYYEGPDAVGRQQGLTNLGWGFGGYHAGHLLKRVHARVLIGDGAEDRLAPVADSRILDATIPHAQLKIYPDAAHGFLFQDTQDWVARVDHFLR